MDSYWRSRNHIILNFITMNKENILNEIQSIEKQKTAFQQAQIQLQQQQTENARNFTLCEGALIAFRSILQQIEASEKASAEAAEKIKTESEEKKSDEVNNDSAI